MRHPQWLSGMVLALAACSNDFAPYSSLDRLRVLGIQAEPATPLPGETATLSALTYAPDAEPARHWSFCPVTAQASDDYACPVDQALAAQLFAPYLADGVSLPSLDLGTGATATLANPFSGDGLAALCTSGLTSPLFARQVDCEGGYPVTVMLEASTATASLRALFVLRLATGAAAELNHNPAPTGLQLAGIPLGDIPAVVTLVPGTTVDLHMDVPASAAEARAIPPSEGPPGQRLERLTTSWFASSGAIDKDRTSFIDGVATLDEMAHNRFTVPRADEWPANGLVEFAIVVRDDRGGEGWLVRQVVLEVAP